MAFSTRLLQQLAQQAAAHRQQHLVLVRVCRPGCTQGIITLHQLLHLNPCLSAHTMHGMRTL